jgi:hypothetical protein
VKLIGCCGDWIVKRLTPEALRDKLWKAMHDVEAGDLKIDEYRAMVYGASILIKTAKLRSDPNSLETDETQTPVLDIANEP